MDQIVLTRRRVLAGALLLVVLLLLGVRLLGRGSSAPGAPPIIGSAEAAVGVDAAQPAASPKLVVYVTGAVRRPGVYRLKDGTRVQDAVLRAGGPTRKADLAAVNLAAPLIDGEQVLVPGRIPAAVAAAEGAPLPADVASAPAAPVQLSVATVEQLDSLPGIGPVTAQKIVDYRNANGPFRSVDDLDEVPGIGPTRIDQLRGLVVP